MANKGLKQKGSNKQLYKRIGILLVALIFLYVVLPQIKGLKSSFNNLENANFSYVIGAVIFTIGTFFVAAVMYQLLKKHKLYYTNTLLVQTSSGFANRLLPAGIGGMGLFAQYLRTQKHSTTQAVTVVGLNNVIGIIGHFTLFLLVILFGNASLNAVHLPKFAKVQYIALVVVLIIIVNLVVFRKLRESAARSLKHIFKDLKEYGKQPYILVLAFLDSLAITFLYVGVLYSCMLALGIDLSVSKVLVVFTVGAVIGNATPTPGGLVATEAGLFAGFVAYGVDSADALSITLLYRLITYWLPILPGIVAFWYAQKKLKLIT